MSAIQLSLLHPGRSQKLLQEMSYARTFGNGSLPPIPLSISTLPPMLTTRALRCGAPKGSPSRIGKNLARYYGFTENVHILFSFGSHFSLTTSLVNSWLWEEYSQVCCLRLVAPQCNLRELAPRSFRTSNLCLMPNRLS